MNHTHALLRMLQACVVRIGVVDMLTLKATFSCAELLGQLHCDLQPHWQRRLRKMRGVRIDSLAQLDPGRWRHRPRRPRRTRDGLNELSIPYVFHRLPRDVTRLHHLAVPGAYDGRVCVPPIVQGHAWQEPRARVAFCIALESSQRLFPKNAPA